MNRTALPAATLAAAMLLGHQAQGVQVAQATSMTDLVMYGIDADTHELVRYTFADDQFTRLGVVKDQSGLEIEHPESLCYVPTGPDKGFYTATTRFGVAARRNRLAKVDGVTLSAYLYAPQFTSKGVLGLVPDKDPVTGVWSLLAVAQNGGDPKFTRIDLTTGADTVICDLPDAGSFLPAPSAAEQYEDMCAHADPTKLWLLTNEKLIQFTRPTVALPGGAFAVKGVHPIHRRTEALGIAFGDSGPAITVPGLPASWTAQGALFSFSDTLNELLVYAHDPTPAPLGIWRLTSFPNSFSTVDCEGIVIFTKNNDPFGVINDPIGD